MTEFFIKAPGKGSSYEYKFHVCSAENETADFAQIGATLPDPSLSCKKCAKAGPDVSRLGSKCGAPWFRFALLVVPRCQVVVCFSL